MSCEACAFNRHCETWREPRNRLVSQISAAGPLPFLCHAGLDWQNSMAHIIPIRLQVQAGARPVACAGWKQAVRARRWPADPALRLYQRLLARDALLIADRFMDGEATERALQRALTPLGEFYRGPRAWQIARMIPGQAWDKGGVQTRRLQVGPLPGLK